MVTNVVHPVVEVPVAALNLGLYQRHKTVKQQRNAALRVKQMVKNFQPNLWRAPIVSVREDGSLYVVDGWHRVLLARVLGWETLQVEIRRGLDGREEAELFAWLNSAKFTKPTSPKEQYDAALEAADPFVIEIDKVVHEVGLEFDRDLFCWAAVRQVHFRCGVEVLRTSLIVLKDVADDKPIEAWLLKNVAEVVNKAGWRLNPDLLHTIVVSRLDDIGKEWKRTSSENKTAAANFIVKTYNRGLPNGQRIPKVA